MQTSVKPALAAGAAEPIVRIVDVCKSYDGGPNVIEGLNLDIARGEFLTLLGPSGSGKTTTMMMLAGFEFPTSGSIFVGDRLINDVPPERRNAGMVFQNYALFPHMTVAQNIAFGLEMLGKPKADISRTTAEMLALVKMEPMAGRKITQISGGQQQRVALARALAPKPQVLLLDEPLSALDLQLRKEMQIELKKLQQETGITFIFVTHDQEEALTMSDRVAVMDRGRILQIGSPQEIYQSPSNRFVASFIGEINLLNARAEKGGFAVAGCGTLKATSPAAAKAKSQVTLAIRPERIILGKPGKGMLPGKVENIVFHGTDTIYHLRLPDGTLVRARLQNSTPEVMPFGVGDTVGWSTDSRSISILGDE